MWNGCWCELESRLADSIMKCIEIKSNALEPIWQGRVEGEGRDCNVVCTIAFQLSSVTFTHIPLVYAFHHHLVAWSFLHVKMSGMKQNILNVKQKWEIIQRLEIVKSKNVNIQISRFCSTTVV